ncbi:hypothetical protein SNE35_03150 [Paucibacter sp. R3-3]|uniref:Uncharacterized protein n=1 Tax=Roseateles agri TaxID=3098619 RepID=A0ABU5DB25_9BURK|nr:hypothetical protein [Paucibacter sp. R3-3]MDY0743481.1 hypothetical protein [Paucibacter sp. R3-3]
MSPMSLVHLSGQTLQASHENGDLPSPHGERGERNWAAFIGLALPLFVATLMVFARFH